jgi:hypothetical protein
LPNLSFKDIPNLVSKIDNVEKFFKSIQWIKYFRTFKALIQGFEFCLFMYDK